MGEAIRRVQLAMGEVRVVEKKKDGTVIDQRVVNYPAIVRARQAYLAAAKVIGQVRIDEGLASGQKAVVRLGVQAALVKLEECRREIERFQGLTV